MSNKSDAEMFDEMRRILIGHSADVEAVDSRMLGPRRLPIDIVYRLLAESSEIVQLTVFLPSALNITGAVLRLSCAEGVAQAQIGFSSNVIDPKAGAETRYQQAIQRVEYYPIMDAAASLALSQTYDGMPSFTRYSE